MIDQTNLHATVIVENLYQALRRVKRSAAPEPPFVRPNGPRRRSRVPVFTHVRLEANASTLTLTCTDLRVADAVTVAVVHGVAGAFCVPVRLLTNIVAQLRKTKEQVTLKVRPAKIGVWEPGGRDRELPSVLVVSCGNATFRLVGLSAEDFPVTDSIPRRDLARGEEVVDAAPF